MSFQVIHHPDIPVKLRAKWCGPSALSAVTGLSTEECCAAINKLRGQKPYYQTQGVYWNEMTRALDAIGFSVKGQSPKTLRCQAGGKTLRRFLEARSASQMESRMIVMIKGHYLSLEGTRLVDSVNPEGIPWRDYSKLRSIVIGWAVVIADRSRPQGLADWEPKSHGHYARKKARLSAQRRAESLAKSMDATITDTSTELELNAPDGRSFDGLHWETFPYEVGTKVDAWCSVVEAMTRVKVSGWSVCEPSCYCKES